MDWDALVRDEVHPLVPYAPGLRASEVRERSGVTDVVKLSSNEHPTGPFPIAIDAMKAVVGRVNRYPDGAATALRRRLAEHLGQDMGSIVVGNGSNEVIRLIAEALISPGDEVVFAWPSFIVYPMVTQIFGGTAVRVPLGEGDTHDLEAMAAAVTERTKLVFLCNPNNPTGTIYHKTEFERFLQAVPDNVPIVVDEAYFEYVDDPEYPNALEYFDPNGRIAVLRTFSKIYALAGLRVGYGVVPTGLAKALNQVREPFNVNTVSQVAAYYSLSDPAELALRQRGNLAEKARLCAHLDSLGLTWAESETNFVYVHTDKPSELFDLLLSQGVIVRDFGTAPALRIGVGTAEETQRTCEALSYAAERLG